MTRNQSSNAALMRELSALLSVIMILSLIYGLILICH